MRSILVVVLLALAALPLRGQLVSPGKLSSAHAKLEGVGSCTKCHDFGSNTFRSNCLACHTEIRTRVERGLGYHAYTKKLECATCHKEHHGRDFKLIRWDPAKFDHRQAGFPLDGRHAGRQCRDCHTPKNIVQAEIRKKSAGMQQRTFLGLEPDCANCHRDQHDGQLGKNCETCHSTAGWKEESFIHARTRFPLTGRHAAVDCAKCHPTEGGVQRFKGIAHRQCLDCHEDTQHKGAFGTECATCHSTAGWKQVRMAQGSFDHAKTHFPLEGRHAQVACAKCHVGGDARRFEGKDLTRCTTCHTDAHAGQFQHRADGGECSACHVVDGFTDLRFDAAAHQTTRFPLAQAHGAVPCRACHTTTAAGGARRFRWEEVACTSCHADPHAGQFRDRIRTGGCTSCHNSTSWHAMEIDHARTAFPLLGRHRSVACARCHTEGDIDGVRTVRYRLAHEHCSDCHVDRHRGQFADARGATDCARCHTVAGWKPSVFDHATARFQLEGRHAALPCTACHHEEATGDGGTVRRYTPIDARCEACHKERAQ